MAGTALWPWGERLHCSVGGAVRAQLLGGAALSPPLKPHALLVLAPWQVDHNTRTTRWSHPVLSQDTVEELARMGAAQRLHQASQLPGAHSFHWQRAASSTAAVMASPASHWATPLGSAAQTSSAGFATAAAGAGRGGQGPLASSPLTPGALLSAAAAGKEGTGPSSPMWAGGAPGTPPSTGRRRGGLDGGGGGEADQGAATER